PPATSRATRPRAPHATPRPMPGSHACGYRRPRCAATRPGLLPSSCTAVTRRTRPGSRWPRRSQPAPPCRSSYHPPTPTGSETPKGPLVAFNATMGPSGALPGGIRRSGGDAVDAPVVVGADVAQPVVQAILAALPELGRHRAHPPAAPVRRHGDLLDVGEPALDRRQMVVEGFPAADPRRLRRGPRPQLRPAGPSAPVLGRLLGADLLHLAAHRHLTLQRIPGEGHRGEPRRGQIVALGRRVVRVEH